MASNNESFIQKLMNIICWRKQTNSQEEAKEGVLPYNLYRQEKKTLEFNQVTLMVRDALTAFDLRMDESTV